MAITGVKSRFVVTAGGVIMLLLGLLPGLGRVGRGLCPCPCLGGAGIVLFGTVAASGIRTLGRVKFEGTPNLIIVATSIGIGMLPIAAPKILRGVPPRGSRPSSTRGSAPPRSPLCSTSCHEITLTHPRRAVAGVQLEARRATFPGGARDLQSHLQEGDTVKDGRLLDWRQRGAGDHRRLR
ncbi:solute carrier family 23 protein [Kocuria rhizophila]|nr:solute carrier family 23 protein [Kocuria rhizophila]